MRNDGTVWAWGLNVENELGSGIVVDISNAPVPVSSLTGITAISEGDLHCLALRNDGTVWTWGYNQYGELGSSDNAILSSVPVQVKDLTDVIAIAGGDEHGLALVGLRTLRSNPQPVHARPMPSPHGSPLHH